MKAWTYDTFPKNRTVYIRRKSHGGPGGAAALVLAFCSAGVMVMASDRKTGKGTATWITWTELFLSCEQHNGKPCAGK